MPILETPLQIQDALSNWDNNKVPRPTTISNAGAWSATWDPNQVELATHRIKCGTMPPGYDALNSDGAVPSNVMRATMLAKAPTLAGFYSENNSKGRTPCSVDSGSAFPSGNDHHAHWVVDSTWGGRGASSPSECSWSCDTYYQKTGDGTACEPAEAITGFDITGLTTVGSKEVSKSATVSLSITGTGIDRWYVTEIPPGTGDGKFTPSTISDTEGGRVWTNSGASAPDSYTLSDTPTDGDYILYVWGADGADNVKITSQSHSFTLDTTAPVLTATQQTPDPQIGGTQVGFDLSATDLAGATITYHYCIGSDVACDDESEFTAISDVSATVNIDLAAHNTFGTKTIHFGVKDDMGNWGTQKKTWNYHICKSDKVESNNDFPHGVQQRTCANNGSAWGDYSIESCEAGYYQSGSACTPVIENTGKYALASGTDALECADAISSEPNDHFVWTNPAKASIPATQCTWKCDIGWVKKTTGSTHSCVECIYNADPKNTASGSITDGTKTRDCKNDDTWADWTYACTSDASRLNADNTGCITCPIGKYLSDGSDGCKDVLRQPSFPRQRSSGNSV